VKPERRRERSFWRIQCAPQVSRFICLIGLLGWSYTAAAADAHARIEGQQTVGKVILVP